ncbi:MAG: phenylacetic acid degradation protein PaaY [Alcaligenaceae bacterium]|jgi:phenylacetic acid degradation protein/carnitine operon protein CaiE|nr:phenylacetic acid degradation protein PaaY [Alcaligenaceae bacterium]
MENIYAIDGIVPVIDETAFVHPTAVIIGDVIIGPGVYVGPLASLRGDYGRIIMKEGSNIQDTCVIHGDGRQDTIIEVDGHIGHGAVIHGCVIGRNVLVGMNAVVMDEVVVGANSIIGATAFVKKGMVIPEYSLVAGAPAKIIKTLTDEDLKHKVLGTQKYQRLARRSHASLERVQPLRELPADRPRLTREQVWPEHLLDK